MSLSFLLFVIVSFEAVLFVRIRAKEPDIDDPPTSHGTFTNPGTPGGVTVSFDCALREYAYEYGKQLQPRHGPFVTLFDALQLSACNQTRPQQTQQTPPEPQTSANSNSIYWSPPVFPSTPSNTNTHTLVDELTAEQKTYTRLSADANANANAAACIFYVDPVSGKDSNAGTSANAPYLTIMKGVGSTRSTRVGNQVCVLNLMAGTFYLSNTIELTSADSYLTIQNYNGAEVVISGGKVIEFSGDWQSHSYAPQQWQNYSNMNNVWGRAESDSSNDLVRYLGVKQSYDDCLSAVQTSNNNAHRTNEPFLHSLTWHNTRVSGYAGHCYGVRDISWQAYADEGIMSGRFIGSNIWSRAVSNIDNSVGAGIPGLRVNNLRGIRARYPDQNTETAMQYDPSSGWIAYDTTWAPPAKYAAAKDIIQNADNWPGVEWPMEGPGGTPYTGEGDWGDYWLGAGGVCNTENALGNVDPPYGYWCSEDAPRILVDDGIQPHMTPTGMTIDADVVPNAKRYTRSSLTDAVVFSWRPYHWYNWMWDAGTYNANSGQLQFSRGGFQGGEGMPYGDIWYIENVFEELTAPMEYYYNRSTGVLYYFNNETDAKAPPSASSVFVSTNLRVLFNISGGSQSTPAVNISLRGLVLRDTRYTYMDSHGLPSGGDWALQRQACVYLANTEASTVQGNLFTRLDGIGIFLSGYNRGTLVDANDFEWIGESAIASWGYTSGLESVVPGGGPDGRDGNQPRFIHVSNNMARELGVFEKQSSFWFQAQTCQTTLENNIVFNIPRAALNFNDGFGQNNHIHDNLLLNTCRESGDHGPWNSWDRVPYITEVGRGPGIPSVIPGYNFIYRNFIIANYQSVGAIDTDDGSAYYNIHNNFFSYGDMGLKSDYAGHNIYHNFNLYGYVGQAYGIWGYSGAENQFIGNAVVMNNNKGYASDCDLPDGCVGFQISNNSVYVPNPGNVRECGESFAQWQAKGHDPGTTLHALPSDQEIIQWAKAILAVQS